MTFQIMANSDSRAPGSPQIRHGSDTFVLDRCLIDVNPRDFATWKETNVYSTTSKWHGKYQIHKMMVWYSNYSSRIRDMEWKQHADISCTRTVLNSAWTSESWLTNNTKIYLLKRKCLNFTGNLLKCVTDNLNGTPNLFHYHYTWFL